VIAAIIDHCPLVLDHSPRNSQLLSRTTTVTSTFSFPTTIRFAAGAAAVVAGGIAVRRPLLVTEAGLAEAE
jgi:hypothetical protein